MLKKYNMITEFVEEFGGEIDTSCNGLSLFKRLSRNMTKIKAQKWDKKDFQFLTSESTLRVRAMTILERELLVRKNKMLMKEMEIIKTSARISRRPSGNVQ